MKVYLVKKPYYDSYSDTTYHEVEMAFATQELAQEFVDYEIGKFEIEEIEVFTEPRASTVRTQEKVAEGRIVIRKTKEDGNSFRFPSQPNKE